jgi:protein N-terminal amidase
LLNCAQLTKLGYNFKSQEQICPYLEPTTSGRSTLWAQETARKYKCFVTVGYPEIAEIGKSPTDSIVSRYYNSAVTVNAEGDVIANYRKSFLYYTDETWALEGSGFFSGKIANLGNVAMGICESPVREIHPQLTKVFLGMDLK